MLQSQTCSLPTCLPISSEEISEQLPLCISTQDPFRGNIYKPGIILYS